MHAVETKFRRKNNSFARMNKIAYYLGMSSSNAMKIIAFVACRTLLSHQMPLKWFEHGIREHRKYKSAFWSILFSSRFHRRSSLPSSSPSG
ncbi:hypothetical protein T4A_7175 [Trichinella pseudospiralis]|uniref:Uncharacterized protein n=1 Tax=Trichinella pseudospiralis TaxID=6337 RepID=A0A0V1DVF3_TRIPS|nr:hypothetical protein T4A_7175 [Trichinella pseudospiralis]